MLETAQQDDPIDAQEMSVSCIYKNNNLLSGEKK